MGREVSLGVFPMGIDTAAWSAHAADPEIEKRAEEIRREAGGRKIVLGMDRLDYTKGILQRLLAVERLLENEPSLRDGFRFIQVTVPSREKVESYANCATVSTSWSGESTADSRRRVRCQSTG